MGDGLDGLPGGNTIQIGSMICIEPEEKPPEKKQITELVTCPVNPRFQQQNKTTWCYTMFIDFHRCAYLLGAETDQCKYFEKCYQALCPNHWIKEWDEQIEAGSFPRDLKKEMGR